MTVLAVDHHERARGFTSRWLLLGSIAYAIVVSVVSGLYPAGRAAKVDPIAALRYE